MSIGTGFQVLPPVIRPSPDLASPPSGPTDTAPNRSAAGVSGAARPTDAAAEAPATDAVALTRRGKHLLRITA
jgi:hypothetical protein